MSTATNAEGNRVPRALGEFGFDANRRSRRLEGAPLFDNLGDGKGLIALGDPMLLVWDIEQKMQWHISRPVAESFDYFTSSLDRDMPL